MKAKMPSKKKGPLSTELKPATADWTILIYMAGDNDLNDFGADDIIEMKRIGSSDKVHVIVQRDTSAAGIGTKRYRVTKGTDMEADLVKDIGETNTGDPKVLIDFLSWGLKSYPAKRTMAVLWNHGAGWDDTDIYENARRMGLNPPPARPASSDGPRRSGLRGRPMLHGGFIHRSAARKRFRPSFFLTAYVTQEEKPGGPRRAIAFDDDAQDLLDSVEMKNVFASVSKKSKRKFDVIGMDACLMSMVETGVQVQQFGEVFCGSQEVEPGEGWPYDRILKKLAANSAMTGQQLTTIIVKEFVASYPASKPVTQSAIELKRLSAVAKAADALGTLLTKSLKNSGDLNLRGALAVAHNRSQGYEHKDYVDLWDFAENLAALWPEGAAAAQQVQSAIKAAVIANAAPHAAVGRSHGLSIYLPRAEISPLYQNLDFAKGGWASFLRARLA